MRIIKTLLNEKYVKLKKVFEPEKGVEGYLFAERMGRDSVAFICYDREKNKYLINKEYTPPIGKFLERAFGGSIDKKKSKVDIVIDEVKEEAGYVVTRDSITKVGEVFVSTQMNQFVHLYLVMVSEKCRSEREPENKTEALSTPMWVDEDHIISGSDWKSICIIEKAKFKSKRRT